MSNSTTPPAGLLPDLSNALAEAVERGARSTVTVHGRGRLPSTGVHWRTGIIVTADHTLERSEEITIWAPGLGSASVTVAGRDPTTDLAALKADALDLPVAEPAKLEALKVGHLALAIGRPGESGPSAAFGVISAIGPAWNTWRGGRIDRFVRADIDLYHGFSGGPLVDAQGRAIGINTSGLSRRFDLTIPASTVDRVLEQLLTKGRVARGYLGLGMQPVRVPETMVKGLGLSSSGGVIVVSVEPGQPAEKAGILIGDVIIGLDSSPITDHEDVLALLSPERIGKKIEARVIRGGSLATLTPIVGERPANWE